ASSIAQPVIARPATRGRRRQVRHAAVVYLTNLILGILFMLPFLWTLSSALKSDGEIFEFPPRLIPATPQPYNFVEIFQTPYRFGLWTTNSIVVALLASAGTVATASLVAYGFARFDFRF